MHVVEELAGYCNREKWQRGKLVSSADMPTMSKDMDDQLKVAHKRVCVTPLRYSVYKPEKPYAIVRVFARKREARSFSNCRSGKKLQEFIYLIDVMNSVIDKVTTKQPILKSYKIFSISPTYSASFFSIRVRMSWNIEDNKQIHHSQTKIKFGTLSWCTYNCENIPRKRFLTVIHKQYFPDTEKTDSKEEFFPDMDSI